ncbi:hypothetical protein EPIB1_1409 [Tritonibacter mobilis]|nr:hypothetical protein EPIB1_1409 [Tritonibacter mobilis]
MFPPNHTLTIIFVSNFFTFFDCARIIAHQKRAKKLSAEQ